jgi:hypothetical protein
MWLYMINTRLTGSASKHVQPRSIDQSVTEPVNFVLKPPRGIATSLQAWLEVANLLAPPPPLQEFNSVDDFLSVGPRQKWENNILATSPFELVRRLEHSGILAESAITATLDMPLSHTNELEAERFHALACAVATTLYGLIVATSPRTLQAVGDAPLLISRRYLNPATSRSEVWMRHGVIGIHWLDPFREFIRVLEGIEATRVRQCPICDRFFLAIRKDQKACSKRCNAVRRVRSWRANEEQHEYRRKLRGAGLLGRRKKRRQSNARSRI